MIIGVSAAAGAAATSVANARTRAVGQDAPLPPILSIGFAAKGSPSFQPANSMSNAIGVAGSALRFTVHGMRTANPAAPSPNVRITTFFNSEGTALPFFAWGTGGARVSFNVDGAEPVFIGVEGANRSGHDGRRVAVESLSNNGAGFGLSEDVGLAEGTYVIALRRTAADQTPNWHALTLDEEELASGGQMIVRRGELAPEFDYLVLSVAQA